MGSRLRILTFKRIAHEDSFWYYYYYLFYQGFLHSHWRLTEQQGKGGDHLLFHSTTSTSSRTLRHLLATFENKYRRWLWLWSLNKRWNLNVLKVKSEPEFFSSFYFLSLNIYATDLIHLYKNTSNITLRRIIYPSLESMLIFCNLFAT